MAKAAAKNNPPAEKDAPPATAEGGGGRAEAEEPIITNLLITSRREGFRRAGRPWSATPTLVEAQAFTEDQVKALLGEPLLEVLPMTAEAAEAWAKRD